MLEDNESEVNEEAEKLADKIAYEEMEKERTAGLKPLYVFLTSALNVELVYVILQGITQFTLLNFIKNGLTKDQQKRFEEMEYKVEKGGDTTILIRSFLIKDISSWQKTSGQDFFADYYNQRGTIDGWKNRKSSKI